MSDRLPVFRLLRGKADLDRLISIGRAAFEITEFELADRVPWTTLRSGPHRVELCTLSGGLWAANEAELWNPELQPSLPDEAEAREIAHDFVRRYELLADVEPESPFKWQIDAGPGTVLAVQEGEEHRADRRLDTAVTYSARVVVESGRESRELPVIGGGGKMTVTLGNEGRVIGYNGLWREVADRGFLVEILSREEVDRRFEDLVQGLEMESYEARLAYYAAPSGIGQRFMYPVYVYTGMAVIDDSLMPLREVMLPATEFGPTWPELQPQPPIRKPRTGLVATLAATVFPRSYVTWLLNPFEAGTSWIGVSGGLPGAKNNAKGFVDELADDGWTINFNWGDANAWESDWRRNDDTWVDAADFVFYTGHADPHGWTLSSPDDGKLHSNEVGAQPQTPGDLWGQQDLEWLIIAACGPLQDDVITKNGGDVLARWDGAFDGLHLLMGYGAATMDNELEGRRIVEYARDGATLSNAWFRTAREIQPSSNNYQAPFGPDIWVGTMWVADTTKPSPINDHLWGHGSVAPDPHSPNLKACMWTRT